MKNNTNLNKYNNLVNNNKAINSNEFYYDKKKRKNKKVILLKIEKSILITIENFGPEKLDNDAFNSNNNNSKNK